MEYLKLQEISTHGGTQAREQTDWLVVDEYVHAMQDGATFPPIVVFWDGSDYWLADGFHRVEAATRAGLETLPAEVKQGTRRDAVLYACGANAAHGLRRTPADVRRAIETLASDPEWGRKTDGEIAAIVGVTRQRVSQVRAALPSSKSLPDTPRTVTRNGVTYPMNTKNIGKPTAPEPEPESLPFDDLPEEEEGAAVPPFSPAAPDEMLDDRSEFAAEQAGQPLAAQSITTPPVCIIHGDAQQVGELVADPVHLVVTSPPYNVGIDYDQHTDDLTTYLPMLLNVWRGCYRVMVEGARICVVVPFGVGRSPYVPFDGPIMQTLTEAGFTVRGRIVWDKNTTGNRTSWGSFRMASSPALRDTTECIIVAHKGTGTLPIPPEHIYRDDKGSFTAWLSDSDYFMELAQDHWVIAPESAQRVKHPAPFPIELVSRLIHFYAFPGAHILDPFGGSGTTGIAAKRLRCQATLIDLSSDYCALAQRRLDDDR